MPTTDELTRYADVALRVGIRDLDRRLHVRAHVEAVDFVRVLVRRAYELGVPRVDVVWLDPVVDVVAAEHAPTDALDVAPLDTLGVVDAVDRGDAFLRVSGGEYPALTGAAAAGYSRIVAAAREALRPWYEVAREDALPWTIVAHPAVAWARQVFPGAADDDEAMVRLWEAIARVARLDADDPVAAWQAHGADLAARADHVTGLDLVQLEYRGPGTDLVVGVAGRRWVGGAGLGGFGNIPNIPTEEVFTSPHRDQVDGTVALTKPYVFRGEQIVGGRLTFVDGVVTEGVCDEGQAALDRLLATDDGSRRLGEVALVPHSSRVARERLLWSHPLFDENEDCHIALGMSYAFTDPGAVGLDEDEQLARGLNRSGVHEDVVVGGDQLDVTGIARDGGRYPLLAGGEWAFTPQ